MATATMVGGGLYAANWFNIGADATGDGTLTVEAAHAAATGGGILLVDIRRPDEWSRTGTGEGAHLIDMRRTDFTDELSRLVQGDRSRAVALICARGVRSRAMTNRLAAAGFTNVMDVPEGMLGSGAGQGWLRKGLPVVPYSG